MVIPYWCKPKPANLLRHTSPLHRRHPGCVVASDVRMNRHHLGIGPFVYCDVQDKDNLARIILENGITAIIHLATLLSGRPIPCFTDFHAPKQVNMPLENDTGWDRKSDVLILWASLAVANDLHPYFMQQLESRIPSSP